MLLVVVTWIARHTTLNLKTNLKTRIIYFNGSFTPRDTRSSHWCSQSVAMSETSIISRLCSSCFGAKRPNFYLLTYDLQFRQDPALTKAGSWRDAWCEWSEVLALQVNPEWKQGAVCSVLNWLNWFNFSPAISLVFSSFLKSSERKSKILTMEESE
jgi:hypothetical protein